MALRGTEEMICVAKFTKDADEPSVGERISNCAISAHNQIQDLLVQLPELGLRVARWLERQEELTSSLPIVDTLVAQLQRIGGSWCRHGLKPRRRLL
jgi:hypothetical protein